MLNNNLIPKVNDFHYGLTKKNLEINPSSLILSHQLLNWYYYDASAYKDHSNNGGADFTLNNITIGSKNNNDTLIFNGVNSYIRSLNFPEIYNGVNPNNNIFDPRCRFLLVKVTGSGAVGQFLVSTNRVGSNDYIAFNPAYKGFNDTFLHNVYSSGTITVTDFLKNPFVSQNKWILIIINAKYSTIPPLSKFVERYVINLTDNTFFYNFESPLSAAINNNGNFDSIRGQQVDNGSFYGHFFKGELAEEFMFIPEIVNTNISWDLINGLGYYICNKWGFNYIPH